jgi:small subunit ribosomal protein S16
MSVSVRLSLAGKKDQPVYRIVVTETRSKRDGKNLDILGFYDPNQTPAVMKVDQKRLNDWVKRGAIVSTGLRKVLSGEKIKEAKK